jgi:hypothetical protein
MKGEWTPEEDAKLTEVVEKDGTQHWIAVAAMVPGRKNIQCRHDVSGLCIQDAPQTQWRKIRTVFDHEALDSVPV